MGEFYEGKPLKISLKRRKNNMGQIKKNIKKQMKFCNEKKQNERKQKYLNQQNGQ